MKEFIRKRIVALKRKPQTIALIAFGLAFLYYSLNLTKISDTTAYINLPGMGLAGFIGLPPMNFFDVTFEDGALKGKGFEVKLSDEEKATLANYNRKAITLGVRPEDIAEGEGLCVKVFSNENLGMNTLVHGHMGDNIRVTAKLRGWANYRPGDTVKLQLRRKHFFDRETTNAIRKGDR